VFAVERIEDLIERALETGQPLRMHLRDGEVLVAQLLSAGDGRVRCRVLTSSRPENHAHCDSTGLELALAQISRAAALPPGRR
jgi:hypothetical protein